MERTAQDLKQWSHGMVGKVYYQKHDKDKNQYRTIRLSFNPFANKIVPQFSNFITGEVPPNIPALPPTLLGSLSRFQANTPEFY